MAVVKDKFFEPGDYLIYTGPTVGHTKAGMKFKFNIYKDCAGKTAMVFGYRSGSAGAFEAPSKFFTLDSSVPTSKIRTRKMVQYKLVEGKWTQEEVEVKCAMCSKPCRPDPTDEYDLCKKCDGTAKPRRKKQRTQLTISQDHIIIK